MYHNFYSKRIINFLLIISFLISTTLQAEDKVSISGNNGKKIEIKNSDEIEIKAEDHWKHNNDENKQIYTYNLSTYTGDKNNKKRILIGITEKPTFNKIIISNNTNDRIYKAEKDRYGIMLENDSDKLKLKDSRNNSQVTLTNIKAGEEDTDAVNYSQLKKLDEKIENNSFHYFSLYDYIDKNPTHHRPYYFPFNKYNDGAAGKGAIALGRSYAIGDSAIAIGDNAGVGAKDYLLEDSDVMKNFIQKYSSNPTKEIKEYEEKLKELIEITKKLDNKNVIHTKEDKQKLINLKREIMDNYGKYLSPSITGENSIAIGAHSRALGYDAVAIGTKATAYDFSVSIGKEAKAKRGALALGDHANANSNSSIALGIGSFANRDGNINLSKQDAKKIMTEEDYKKFEELDNEYNEINKLIANKEIDMYNPKYFKPANLDIEKRKIASKYVGTLGALSVGNDEQGETRQIINVAMGEKDTDAVNVFQLKKYINEQKTRYISINKNGEEAKQKEKDETNYNNDTAYGDNSIAIGVLAKVGKKDSKITGNNSVGIGYKANIQAEKSTAIGAETEVMAGYSTIIGYKSKSNSKNSIAIGVESEIEKNSEESIAIGYKSKASSKGAIAIGNSRGDNKQFTKALQDSIAIGSGAVANSNWSVAIGSNTLTQESESVAIGDRAKSLKKAGIAIGESAETTVEGAIALGKNSKARREKNSKFFDFVTNSEREYSGENKHFWLATTSALSIGDETSKATRQLTNLAAGTNDTDAVNVAQLKSLIAQNPFEYATKDGDQTYKVIKRGENFYKIQNNQEIKIEDKNKIFIRAKENFKVSNIKSSLQTVINNSNSGSQNNTTNNKIVNKDENNKNNAVVIEDLKKLEDKIDNQDNQKANKDASNLADSDVTAWKNKLGLNNIKGSVEEVEAVSSSPIKVTSENTANGKKYILDFDSKKAIQDLSSGANLGSTEEIEEDKQKLITDKQINNHLKNNYYNKNEIENKFNNISKNYDEALSGSALAAALAGLNPLTYDSIRPSQFMAAIAGYKNKKAVALGIAHYISESSMLSGGLSVGTDAALMLNLGFTHKFGDKNEIEKLPKKYQAGAITSVYAMQDEIQQLLKENKNKDYLIEIQNQKIEKLQKQVELLLKINNIN